MAAEPIEQLPANGCGTVSARLWVRRRGSIESKLELFDFSGKNIDDEARRVCFALPRQRIGEWVRVPVKMMPTSVPMAGDASGAGSQYVPWPKLHVRLLTSVVASVMAPPRLVETNSTRNADALGNMTRV